jgi:hypothetical protein
VKHEVRQARYCDGRWGLRVTPVPTVAPQALSCRDLARVVLGAGRPLTNPVAISQSASSSYPITQLRSSRYPQAADRMLIRERSNSAPSPESMTAGQHTDCRVGSGCRAPVRPSPQGQHPGDHDNDPSLGHESVRTRTFQAVPLTETPHTRPAQLPRLALLPLPGRKSPQCLDPP